MKPDLERVMRRRRRERLRLLLTGAVGTTVALVAVLLVWNQVMSDAQTPSEDFSSPTLVEGGSPRSQLNMVGDSITLVSKRELNDMFTLREWSNSVVGNWGTTITENRDRIREAAQGQPRSLVIELGTNDLLRASSESTSDIELQTRLESIAAEVRSVLEELRSNACVVWVNINDWATMGPTDFRRVGAWFNLQLGRLQQDFPNLHIADYATLFRPSDPAKLSWVAANFDQSQIHPQSGESRLMLAATVADMAGSLCGI